MAVDLITTMTGAEMNTALTGAHDGKRKAYTAAQISGLNPATWGTGDVLRDDGVRFRSDGSAFIQVGGGLALGETSTTAYRGDRGKEAYDHANTAHFNSVVAGTNVAVDNTDVSNPVVSSTDTVYDDAPLQAVVAGNTTDISVLTETVSNLGSATGQIEDEGASVITTTPQDFAFGVKVQSSDVSIFEIDAATDTFIIKKGGHYAAITSMAFLATANGVINITLEWQDASTSAVLNTRTLQLNLGNNGTEVGSFSTLLEIDEGTVPQSIKFVAYADIAGITITAAETVMTSSLTAAEGVSDHASLTGRSTADSHPLLAITGLQAALDTKSSLPNNVANIVSAVDLSNPLGTYKTNVAINVGSMIIGAVVTGGFQVQMINATSEPSISGATKITGSAFVANTDMYMVCCNNGSRSEYHFQEL